MFDFQNDIFYGRNGKTLQRDSSVYHIIFIKVVNKKAQNRTKCDTRKYSHINIHVRHTFNRDRSNND